MLIVLEGPDGVGKSTQAALLQQMVAAQNPPLPQPQILGFPTKKPFGVAAKRLWDTHILKDIPEATLITPALMAADFFAHSTHLYLASTSSACSGFNVIADRWWYSSLVYTPEREVGANMLYDLYASAPKPDYLFLLTAPVNVCLLRIAERRGHYSHGETKQFQETIHIRYERFLGRSWARHPPEVISTMDSPEKVCETLWTKIKHAFVYTDA